MNMIGSLSPDFSPALLTDRPEGLGDWGVVGDSEPRRVRQSVAPGVRPVYRADGFSPVEAVEMPQRAFSLAPSGAGEKSGSESFNSDAASSFFADFSCVSRKGRGLRCPAPKTEAKRNPAATGRNLDSQDQSAIVVPLQKLIKMFFVKGRSILICPI